MKKFSLFWKIIIGLVLVLGVTTLVLGLIPLNNAPSLATDSLVTIRLQDVSSAGTPELTLKDQGVFSERFNNIKKEYDKARKFSVLRGILVGKVNGMQLSDEETELLTPDDIAAKKADATTAMITFTYEGMQKQTIRGVEFSYNEAKILFSDTENDIGEFIVILYDTSMLAAAGFPADEDYEVQYIKCKGNGTRLLTALTAAIANESDN